MNRINLRNLDNSYCSSLNQFQKKNRLNLNNNLWDENELKNLLTSHGFYGKICLNKDNILAFCLAKTSGDRLEIYSIFVDIFWRRKGIAKKILEDCINFCKKKKVEKIILEVSSKNKVAKKFYLKEKFKICGIREGYYSNRSEKVDALIMEYNI